MVVLGMSESALGDHARDLPVMNGIREDIKGVMAMEQGCPDHLEGLQALAVRMRTLQVTTLSHSALEKYRKQISTRCILASLLWKSETLKVAAILVVASFSFSFCWWLVSDFLHLVVFSSISKVYVNVYVWANPKVFSSSCITSSSYSCNYYISL